MRPPRGDIAAPPWRPGTEWIGDEPPEMERLAARGPVLVHFLDFAQLNSVRALPYALEWERRYRGHGLATIGVHSPRFPFGGDPEVVAAGLERLGVVHPVALDSDHRLWRDYGCHGWPSLFLWGRGGALRWYHLGEGEYAETEAALREALEEAGADSEWPSPLEAIRPTDRPGARVVAPTAEIFPGGSPDEPWRRAGDERELEVEYGAGGAHATVGGTGPLTVSLDGGEPTETEIEAPGLVELASHPVHEQHSIRLEPGEGVLVYSLSFAPGVP